MHYIKPAINLNHLKELTTSFAMIQFSIINKPDLKKVDIRLMIMHALQCVSILN
jgi:hypothetical protein